MPVMKITDRFKIHTLTDCPQTDLDTERGFRMFVCEKERREAEKLFWPPPVCYQAYNPCSWGVRTEIWCNVPVNKEAESKQLWKTIYRSELWDCTAAVGIWHNFSLSVFHNNKCTQTIKIKIIKLGLTQFSCFMSLTLNTETTDKQKQYFLNLTLAGFWTIRENQSRPEQKHAELLTKGQRELVVKREIFLL